MHSTIPFFLAGQKPAGGFGTTSSFGTTPGGFGASTTNLGAGLSTGFGAATTTTGGFGAGGGLGGFGAGAAATGNGTASVPYQEVEFDDGAGMRCKHTCITAMPQYDKKSLEVCFSFSFLGDRSGKGNKMLIVMRFIGNAKKGLGFFSTQRMDWFTSVLRCFCLI